MREGSLIGGKYRLLRPLGRGAMGVVWSAINERTEREVAIKLILTSSGDLAQRLLREARACGRLEHRHIIAIHDVGETDEGEPFLVMQKLTGETLADLLRREGALPQTRAVQIALDIARALGAAHEGGVVHRDLKPANVFLHIEPGADEPVVKVLDFGVSKLLASSDVAATLPGGALGSPLYMSPEQAKGERGVDPRADLWSLGVVLFEMLTGTKPFYGETVIAVLTQMLSAPVPEVTALAPQIAPSLSALVGRCLQRDVNERIGSADELAAGLRIYLPVRERAPDSLRREVPRPRPRRDDDEATQLYRPPHSRRPLPREGTPPLDLPAGSQTLDVDPEPDSLSPPLAPEPPPPTLATSTSPLLQIPRPTPVAPPAAPQAPPRGVPASTRSMLWIGALAGLVAAVVSVVLLLPRERGAPASAAPARAPEVIVAAPEPAAPIVEAPAPVTPPVEPAAAPPEVEKVAPQTTSSAAKVAPKATASAAQPAPTPVAAKAQTTSSAAKPAPVAAKPAPAPKGAALIRDTPF